ncbi:hypothetical protein ACQYZY_28295 [Pseudomonas aeruginosa]|jgi:hypothetical protein|uniref:hypothetical protein n=1 Tax=Pseudomonas aeruginosa TaxID=287 RepID=UPI003753161B
MLNRLKTQAHLAIIPIATSLLVCFTWGISSSIAMVLMAILTSAGFYYVRFKHLDRLQAKASAAESSTLEVWASTGKIGTISEAEYSALELGMGNDAPLFFRQAANVIGVLWRLSYSLVLALPAAMFWLVLVFGIMEPEAIAQAARSLTTMTAADVSNLMDVVITLFLTMPLMVFGISAVIGWPLGSFGFINFYSQERNSLLLKHCGASAVVDAHIRVPAEAAVTTTKGVEG